MRDLKRRRELLSRYGEDYYAFLGGFADKATHQRIAAEILDPSVDFAEFLDILRNPLDNPLSMSLHSAQQSKQCRKGNSVSDPESWLTI